jgi:hypothetical protein
MTSTGFSSPGFGWALLGDSKVEIIKGDFADTIGWNSPLLSELVSSNCPVNFEPLVLWEKIHRALRESFLDETDQVVGEVESSGCSNHRRLRWDIMKIEANTSFVLHAHPNIEVIMVLHGAIHEMRYMVSVPRSCPMHFLESNQGSYPHGGVRLFESRWSRYVEYL